MAKLKKKSKGVVPTIDEASDNLGTLKEKEAIKPMSFKMSIGFYRELKKFGYENDMSFTEIFKKSFYHYRESINNK